MTPQARTSEPGVPHSRFQYDAVAPKDRFAVWSESIAPLFTPEVAPDKAPEDVSVATEVYALGDALLGRSETRGVGGYRCPGDGITRDRSDAVLVQLYTSGGFHGHNGSTSLRVRAGDVVVLDTTRAMATQVSDSAILSFILPRDALVKQVRGSAAEPRVIAGTSPAGRVLAHTFRSTWELLPEATQSEGEALRGLLLGAIGGVVEGQARTAESVNEAPLDRATFEAMRAYIERHLASEELTPEHLCKQFDCSRARLYRLFAPVDGVASFIRRARLERVYGELMRSDESVSILAISLRWGFGNFSHFCRIFRQTYGYTPGEAREAGRAARRARNRGAYSPGGSPVSLPDYREWFARL